MPPLAIDEKTLRKEEASSEKRHWVRLTKVCNNRCVFCLDKESQDGSVVPMGKIRTELKRGREEGCTRLILSGGEATVHPEFTKIVREASGLGYRRIQLVSNGRMFAYKDFLDECVGAGLGEITFSIHGHTPELHDAQTRVPGSFRQTLAGLLNALQCRGLIVNIDIVINGYNYRHVDEIIEKFTQLGVHEFDLLHVTPYGDAWDNRAEVFYDPAEGIKHLNRAFEYSRREDMFIWTNRFPPRYLSAYPELIQNPLKIKDEVRGRLEVFDAFLREDRKIICRGARCGFCFLQGYCDELFRAKKALGSGVVNMLRVAADDIPDAVAAFRGRLPEKFIVHGNSFEEFMKSAELLPANSVVELEFKDYTGADAAGLKKGAGKIKAVASTPDGAELLVLSKRFIPVIELNADTAQFINENRKDLIKSKIRIRPRNRITLLESLERDVDLPQFFAVGGAARLETENVPGCLLQTAPRRMPWFLDFTALDAAGRLDPIKLVGAFIEHGYYVYPVECGECSKKRRCPGIHVNYQRGRGFSPKPFAAHRKK